MAKYLTQIEQKNFVNGWIESGALNAAENTVSDTMNIQYKRDGSAHKRPSFTEDHLDAVSTPANSINMEADGVKFADVLVPTNINHTSTSYHWKLAGGVVDIKVMTLGSNMQFYRYTEGVLGESLGNYVLGTVNLLGPDAAHNIRLAQLGPDLIIVNGGKEIVLMKLGDAMSADSTVDSNFSLIRKAITAEVRDYWGCESPFPDDMEGVSSASYRASSARGHHWNLMNQGWWDRLVTPTIGGTDSMAQQLIETATSTQLLGVFDNWHHGVVKVESKNTWSADKYNAHEDFGTTRAPLGHYILDLFDRGPSRVLQAFNVSTAAELSPSATTGIWSRYGVTAGDDIFDGIHTFVSSRYVRTAYTDDVVFKFDSTDQGFTCLESHAGRVFFAGCGSNQFPESTTPDLRSIVCYSKLGATSDAIGKFYADNDPSSSNYQSLSTDGGFVIISGMSSAKEMISLGRDLVVFGDNGVWCITANGAGFTANDQGVYKVDNIGIQSGLSVVKVDNEIYYFTSSGIRKIGMDRQTGRLTAENISEDRIPSFMAGVMHPHLVQGAYDNVQRKVTWLLSNDAGGKAFYDSSLVLDTLTNAYEQHSWDVSSQVRAGTDTADQLTAHVRGIMTHAECLPLPNETVPSVEAGTLKYMVVIKEDSNDFSNMWAMQMTGDTGYDFWYNSQDGATFSTPMRNDYTAYLETADNQAGDIARKKSGARFTFHFEQTETRAITEIPWGDPAVTGGVATGHILQNASSCLVQAQWDFMEETGSGLWSTQFEAYKFRNPIIIDTTNGGAFNHPQKVITTKTKIRGKGVSVKLRMESPAGHTMKLLGWSSPLSITKRI